MTLDEFETQIANGVTLVDFWANWCGPCQMVSPVLDAISAKYDIPLVKLNVDENRDLAEEFNLMSIPTIMLFVNGQLDKTVVGAYSQDVMEKRLGLS